MRKNLNSLAVNITQQPKHNKEDYNKSKTTTSPFPPGVARYNWSPEIVHSWF